MEMDVRSPLLKGSWIKNDVHGKVWVDFRYEQLCDFCFHCGCVDHIDRYCHIATVSSSSNKFDIG